MTGVKCINTNPKGRGGRGKSRPGPHKVRWALAGMGGAAAVLAVVLAVLILGKDSSADLPMEYRDGGLPARIQRSELFAQNLCVSQDNIALDGVAVNEAESAALFELDSGETLFARNMYQKMYPASVTKIMTGILACKYGNMNDMVTIDSSMLDLESGSQACGLREGDTVTMDALFHALIIFSANDAAMAIAKHISGSVEEL